MQNCSRRKGRQCNSCSVLICELVVNLIVRSRTPITSVLYQLIDTAIGARITARLPTLILLSSNKIKSRSFNWFSSNAKLIKVQTKTLLRDLTYLNCNLFIWHSFLKNTIIVFVDCTTIPITLLLSIETHIIYFDIHLHKP